MIRHQLGPLIDDFDAEGRAHGFFLGHDSLARGQHERRLDLGEAAADLADGVMLLGDTFDGP